MSSLPGFEVAEFGRLCCPRTENDPLRLTYHCFHRLVRGDFSKIVKRILHGILAALGLCSGCSESTLVTPRQFTREFAEELRKSSAELKI